MEKTKIDWNDITWKQIPNHEGYYASKNGEILSVKKKNPIIMKQISAKDGYKYVFMYENGKTEKVWVHRAVLMSWDRLPEPWEETRHLNDIPYDNRLENLCWGTRKENVKDKRKNGGLPIGERSGTHKLTESQVMEIKGLYGTQSLRSIAKKYGVSHTCIRRAALGIKWSYLKEVSNG